MGFFTETQRALADGETVALVLLARFDFAEGTMRVWQGGIGRIFTEPGTLEEQEWLGLGTLGTVGDMQIGAGDAAAFTTFRLSGVDAEILALARESQSVRGRTAALYGAFLSAPKRVLDQPWYIEGGLLDVISYQASGPRERTISMTMESEWSGDSGSSSWSLYSDRDQEGLGYVGDRGLEFMAELTMGAKVSWPY